LEPDVLETVFLANRRGIIYATTNKSLANAGQKLRDLMPVKLEASDEMQVLVLRLAVKGAERFRDSGLRRASHG
jgi:hypothetical protein